MTTTELPDDNPRGPTSDEEALAREIAELEQRLAEAKAKARGRNIPLSGNKSRSRLPIDDNNDDDEKEKSSECLITYLVHSKTIRTWRVV